MGEWLLKKRRVSSHVSSLAWITLLLFGRHVITEMDSEQGEDVTYRLQGDLEHYTEVLAKLHVVIIDGLSISD